MSNSKTLHSRLRVLESRAFRAEKLYTSMRSNANASFNSRFIDSTKLSELANDVRSGVWQHRHFQLRKAINHILSESKNFDVASEVILLRDRFLDKSCSYFEKLEKYHTSLIEAATEGEFTNSLKLSLDLVRNKAESQVNRIIADDLTEVIKASNRKKRISQSNLFSNDLDKTEIEVKKKSLEKSSVSSKNVIPFRRKLSGTR